MKMKSKRGSKKRKRVVRGDGSKDKDAPLPSQVITDKGTVGEMLTPPVVRRLAIQTPTTESLINKDVSYDNDDDGDDDDDDDDDDDEDIVDGVEIGGDDDEDSQDSDIDAQKLAQTMNMSGEQIMKIVKGHLGNCSSIREYKLKKIDEIYEFAQDKAIYLMQFVTSEDQIAYGSTIQKEVCKMVKVAAGMNLSVWDEGGKTAFRKGISSKRKTIMYSVQGALKKCKYLHVCYYRIEY